jgi:hypothetical protein
MPLSLAEVSVAAVSVVGTAGAAVLVATSGVTVAVTGGVVVAGASSATSSVCRGERPLASAVVVAGAGAADAVVGAGRFKGDPTESLTMTALANGSFFFVLPAAGAAAALTECVSDTTGTR